MADRRRLCYNPSLETVMSLPCVMECEVFNAVHLMGGSNSAPHRKSQKESASVLFTTSLLFTQQSCLFFMLPGIVFFFGQSCIFISFGPLVEFFLFFNDLFFSFYFHAFKPCLCPKFCFAFVFVQFL